MRQLWSVAGPSNRPNVSQLLLGSEGVDERLQRCCVAPTQPDKLEVSRFTL